MKKGFLSTSMVYSFFLVFLMVLIFIVANLINNRTLVGRINSDIKSDIYNSSFSGYLINNDIEHLVYFNNDELNDNSYRFVGNATNNYVCFGTNATPCPEDNIYRVIGVIDGKVKLIKNSPISHIIDDTTSLYSATSLASYLNTSNGSNYYDTILFYMDLIATTNYFVGGISNLESDKLHVYNAEMSSSSLLRQIGLMYISDYLYAENSGENWLDVTADTWFITQQNSNTIDEETNFPINNYYYLDSSGNINVGSINLTKNIRPVFYLKNSVKLLSGDGTIDNPYYVGGNNV